MTPLVASKMFGNVRVVTIDIEDKLVERIVLSGKNSSRVLTDHVDIENKLNNKSLSSLGQRRRWLINESYFVNKFLNKDERSIVYE